MAKAKKRAAARKNTGKQSANPSRKKLAKRATPKKAKSKVRRAGVRATKPAAKKKPAPKSVARKAPKQAAEVPVETAITDVIKEPVPSVVVVTEYESIRTAAPLASGGAPERDEGCDPETKPEAA